eukprot:TRINITY_DN81637_c0_g1_i1.p1 TRINITY_DN81637_c0_g1~~TRINITY_DN81637_c0_g1_i1.p1  ORF type:complete len:347 (-),score=50.94 TRINITY_DN81637_c0_g1_i1:104-1144(-)
MAVIQNQQVIEICDSVEGMAWCVDIMRNAFKMLEKGSLDAPPRLAAEMASGHLVFTVGGSREHGNVGFRVYDLHHVDKVEERGEVTVVFGTDAGALRGVVLGRQLGIARTGAIGGVAIDCFASLKAMNLSVIGSGSQARSQVLAALAVRPSLQHCKVWSRRRDRAKRFINDLISIAPARITFVVAESIQEAVKDTDIVITATSSPTPLLHPSWLKVGCHVNYVGPKFVSAHELGVDVLSHCQGITTDALEQLHADKRLTLSGDERVECLSKCLGNRCSAGRTTLFYSLGLAGTEVLLASELITKQLMKTSQVGSFSLVQKHCSALIAGSLAALVAAAALSVLKTRA